MENKREIRLIYHPLVNGQWFEIDPKTINRNFFENKGEEIDEDARELILEAFKEMIKNPDKYAIKFKIRIPKKVTYDGKHYREIQEALNKKNEQIADWVHVALMWAQRIQNGEPWKNLRMNVSLYQRFIIGKNGNIALVGGSCIPYAYYYIEHNIMQTTLNFKSTNKCGVPIIVNYEV